MDEATQRQTSDGGRVLQITVYGNSHTELELAALDKAREFFGPDIQLEVIDEYKASRVPSYEDGGGKMYTAGMTVRALNQRG